MNSEITNTTNKKRVRKQKTKKPHDSNPLAKLSAAVLAALADKYVFVMEGKIVLRPKALAAVQDIELIETRVYIIRGLTK